MLPIVRDNHAPLGQSALGRVVALNAPSPAPWPAAGYIRSTLPVTRGEVIETGTARDGP